MDLLEELITSMEKEIKSEYEVFNKIKDLKGKEFLKLFKKNLEEITYYQEELQTYLFELMQFIKAVHPQVDVHPLIEKLKRSYFIRAFLEKYEKGKPFQG